VPLQEVYRILPPKLKNHGKFIESVRGRIAIFRGKLGVPLCVGNSLECTERGEPRERYSRTFTLQGMLRFQKRREVGNAIERGALLSWGGRRIKSNLKVELNFRNRVKEEGRETERRTEGVQGRTQRHIVYDWVTHLNALKEKPRREGGGKETEFHLRGKRDGVTCSNKPEKEKETHKGIPEPT